MSNLHVIKKNILDNGIAAFHMVFSLYFIVFSLRILMAKDIFYGDQAVFKNLVGAAYKNDFILFLFFLPDEFFISLPVIGICLGVLLFVSSLFRLCNWRKFSLAGRWIFLFFWLILVLFFIRNPIVRSIHVDYLGWLALLNLFISFDQQESPDEVSFAAWCFFAGTYTMSGLKKLMTIEWRQGSAIELILKNEISRFDFSAQMTNMIHYLSPVLSYSVIFLELFALFFIWKRKTKYFLLGASFLMHLGILVLLRIEDLTIGILVFHFFLLTTILHQEKIVSLN
jgi:hypothetical protein